MREKAAKLLGELSHLQLAAFKSHIKQNCVVLSLDKQFGRACNDC